MWLTSSCGIFNFFLFTVHKGSGVNMLEAGNQLFQQQLPLFNLTWIISLPQC